MNFKAAWMLWEELAMGLWLYLPKARESDLRLVLFCTQTAWGTKMCMASWRDQGSRTSCHHLPLLLEHLHKSLLPWKAAPWTLFSLPLQQFSSHLSPCPPQPASCSWSCRFSPVLLKQTRDMEVTSSGVLAHKGKAHRKKKLLYISFVCLIFDTHHLVKGGGGGGCLLPSFSLVKCSCMEMAYLMVFWLLVINRRF